MKQSKILLIICLLFSVSASAAENNVHYQGSLHGRSIKGYCFIDKNSNAIMDDSEKAVEGVKITLKRLFLAGVSRKIKTTKTDENGYYEFLQLRKGRYLVDASSENEYVITTENPVKTRVGIFKKSRIINFQAVETNDELTYVDITAEPGTISRGAKSILKWTSRRAIRLKIDQGVGDVYLNTSMNNSVDKKDNFIVAGTKSEDRDLPWNNISGSIEVFPDNTTTYTITAEGDNGEIARSSVTITVTAAKPAPSVTSSTTTINTDVPADEENSGNGNGTSGGSGNSGSGGTSGSSGDDPATTTTTTTSAAGYTDDNTGVIDIIDSGFDSSNGTVVHAVRIKNALNDVTAFAFDVIYDDDKVQYSGFTGSDCLNNDSLIDCLESVPGKIHCEGFQEANEIVNQGDNCSLVNLYFYFPAETCKPGGCPASLWLESLAHDFEGWGTSNGCFCCPEACNDGEIRTCLKQNGVCEGFYEECLSPGWSGCDYTEISFYEPAETSCGDNLDNDCDGLTDCFDTDCAIEALCAGRENICNDGIDNDNDSLTDCEDYDCEGYEIGTCDTGATGACAVGTFKCSGGQSVCVQNTNSEPELCDNIDNDCDGYTDEDFNAGEECTVGLGECMRTAVLICSDNATGTVCVGEEGLPENEICDDGLDNDCDGLTDCADYDCFSSPGCNLSPSADISSPGDRSFYNHLEEIFFTGTGTDPEDGQLAGNSLVWKSNIDGELGTGTTFSTASLSAGIHTIVLTATDSMGAQGNDAVSITVGIMGGKVWEFETGAYVAYSSPAVSGGYVYVGSNDNKVYCLDAQNGNKKWEFETGNRINSSPLVSGGMVYIGSRDSKLYCLNAQSGSKHWEFKTGNRVNSSPAISPDGTIYVGSWDYKLYAINSDGTFKWSYQTGSRIQSSPSIGPDGTVYFGSDDYRIYALNPNGTLKWSLQTGGCVYSSPAVSGGYVYVGYSGSYDDKVYCIDAQNGDLIWEFETGQDVNSSPAVSGGYVYVGSNDNKVYCLDAQNGNKKWEFETGYYVYSSPAVSGGYVYVGSQDNIVYCLDADSGDPVWEFSTGYLIYSSPAVSGGYVYVGSGDHKVYCIRAADGDTGSWPMFQNNRERTGAR